jgi:DNA repair photolyase
MSIKEIKAKSILRKRKRIDSWFVSHYGMNLYRGCIHDCVYCDGRAEGYYVEGEFGKDVEVKVNSIELLRRELDPKRKRKPLPRSFIMLGGGVGDSYQPVEEKYKLSRQALQVIHEFGFPVHVLTKSTLVERDIDIIKQINKQSRAIVSFSISSIDEGISSIFEPGVPSPGNRLATLAQFKKEGIASGIFLLPVIPFVTDSLELIDRLVSKAKQINIDFIIFGGMTMKQGRQQDYFLKVLKENYPQLLPEYATIYRGDKWGSATPEYYAAISQVFDAVASRHKIAKRIPARLFKDILSENDLLVVILEQIDYLLKLKGAKSPYGYAAHSISKLEEPISTLESVTQLKGVGKATASIISEVLRTGTSSYYEQLLGVRSLH